MKRKRFNKKLPTSLVEKINTYVTLSATKHPVINPNDEERKAFKKAMHSQVQLMYARQSYKDAAMFLRQRIDAEKTRLSFDKLYDKFMSFWEETLKLNPKSDERQKAFIWSLIYKTCIFEGEDKAIEHLDKVLEDKKKAIAKLAEPKSSDEEE